MMKPEHDWNVLDTSCGSGGFLLYALDYIRHQAGEYYEKGSADHYRYWHDFAEKHLYGIEINDEIARVAKMNMIVHDDGHTNVISCDALQSIETIAVHNSGFQKNKFDLVLTNPPFGSTVNGTEKPYLTTFELGNTYDKKGKAKARKNQSSEVLFIERIYEFLKPGTGKAAIVLPDGILTNSSSQYVRDFILEKFQLLAVISLPKDAFAHFGAGVNASVVFLRKKNDFEAARYDCVFMAKPQFIGYDATGCTTMQNQLIEIATLYEEYCTGEKINFDEETGYLVKYSTIDNRIDVDHYSPKFIELKEKIEHSSYPIVCVEDICVSIKSGFAAGKQDQADTLSDEQRAPHLRPFSITTDGELSFATQKYVPLTGLTAADFCEKGEVLFNNTNSIDLVGKTTVFDVDCSCAVSNHITRLKLKEGIDPYYVAAFFNMLLRLDYWKFLCTNFNNQSGINNETLKKVKIILPDIEKQKEFAGELVSHYKKAIQLRKQADIEISTAKENFEKKILGE